MLPPHKTSPAEAAFHLPLAATRAPCTVAVHVVFARRMLPPSLLQHAAALPTHPPCPALLPLRLIALTSPALWTHPFQERF